MSNDTKKKTGRKEDVKVLDRTRRPRRYKVILHNDNFTPRGFVVLVLKEVFNLPEMTASGIMMMVHTTGRGVIGTYSREIAEEKSRRCNKISRDYGFPLTTSTEAE